MTEYMVVAQTSDQWVFWASPLSAGYSVDNVSPGAPLALMAQAVDADVELQWSASGEHDEDLAVYNIYRSNLPDFEPDDTTFLVTTEYTNSTDIGPGPDTWYYVVTAEDIHDNESLPSNEAAATIVTSVDDDGLPTAFALHGNKPNPFNPRTTIVYEVGRAGPITLRVFDLAGRAIKTLVDERLAIGRHEVVWSGVDDAGSAVPSGVYLSRLESGGQVVFGRMTLVR